MRLPDDLSIRDATLDDVPAIGELRLAVGWTVHEWALRIVIGVAHARCVVAIDTDGRLAGVGSGIAYGPLGFIGNMVVAEKHRRRGVGSAILGAGIGFLDEAGCRRLELNATSDGRPLYERHGFETLGTSATARIPRTATTSRDRGVPVRRATGDDLDHLVAFDAARFGGDRRPLLAVLLADPRSESIVAERDGVLAGYACLRLDVPRVGPLLADDPTVAEALLHESFDRAPNVDELRLNLPPGNRAGSEWLRGLGVEIEPWDGRMGRGPSIPRRDDTVYGMAVGALG
jgi:ribosomal protein S18 acetylase RimI-like enzyme